MVSIMITMNDDNDDDDHKTQSIIPRVEKSWDSPLACGKSRAQKGSGPEVAFPSKENDDFIYSNFRPPRMPKSTPLGPWKGSRLAPAQKLH